MPDTVRTLAALQTLLADNVAGDISAQDVRDMLVSVNTPEWMSYLAQRLPDETAHADDDFFETDSSADYTTQTVTGSATWAAPTRGRLTCLFEDQSAADASVHVKPITSAAAPMTIETRMSMIVPPEDNPGAGLVFTDGTAAGSNNAGVLLSGGTSVGQIFARGGTLTNYYSTSTLTIWTGMTLGFYPLYLRMIWTAANTWASAISFDGEQWFDRGATTLSKTMTPTHFGFWVSSESGTNPNQATFDYFRVYDSDLSV